MKRCWTTIALAFSIAAVAAADVNYAPKQVLLKIRPGSANMVNVYHQSIGAKVLKDYPEIGWQLVQVPATTTVPKAMSYYSRLGGIVNATPNRYRQADATTNDPMLSQQYSVPRMKVNAGWDLTTGDETVVIAVLDTGVDYTHPDLAGKVIKGGDHATGDGDPMDEEGHGTHVAGIAGAHTNNGVGIAGIGYNSKILAIRVLGPGGGTESMIVGGILEAANKGADVINMSLGGYFFSQAEQDAVTYAFNRNCVIVASSGNDNIDSLHYPSDFEGVISVGSTDDVDGKSGFSNFGPGVDVAAPGSSIMSTLPGNTYGLSDGTSMASPNAAGVASLIISYAGKGNISNVDVRNIMETTSVKVGTWLVHGRLDADAAVRAAVPPILESRGPTTATMFDGSTFNGTAASLWTNDTAFFTVYSRFVANLGGVSGSEMTFDYNHPADKFQTGKLVIRGYAKYGSTSTAYLKRNDGQYIKLRSWPVSGSQVSANVTLPKDMRNYIKDAKITIVVRNVLPSRFGTSTFGYFLNSAVLDTRTASR